MKNPIEKKQANSIELIKARAALDASSYVVLMREKSPESLKPGPDGKIEINTVDGEPIFRKAKEELNLDSLEMIHYITALEEFLKGNL